MTENGRQRVGIMGGTFDPIHIGHLILAECAYEQYALDYVLFLPAGRPPHKKERQDGASDADRLAMVSLAIRDNPHFKLDAEEMERDGYSYSCETLLRKKERHPDTDYFFIIGADSLLSFDTWRHPEIIAKCCTLLAAVRDDMEMGVMEDKADELSRKYGARILFLDSPNLNVSSTALRTRCHTDRSLRYYVPEAVRAYMEEKQIYREII